MAPGSCPVIRLSPHCAPLWPFGPGMPFFAKRVPFARPGPTSDTNARATRHRERKQFPASPNKHPTETNQSTFFNIKTLVQNLEWKLLPPPHPSLVFLMHHWTKMWISSGWWATMQPLQKTCSRSFAGSPSADGRGRDWGVQPHWHTSLSPLPCSHLVCNFLDFPQCLF